MRDSAAPLYARVLGATWDKLPAEIRNMHDIDLAASATGRASVERGHGVLARLVASFVGFPETTEDVPVSVRFEASNGVETWTRTFGGSSFSSRQSAGGGHSEGLLREHFGPLTFTMALVFEQGRLSLVMRRWNALGVPLPLWLGPRSSSYETTADGRFRFHVEIGHPLTGLIVRYRGWLVRQGT